ncbi:helix-turn-helix transcriptional regulator [Dethiosulfatarculus sandiegensis]|uniref:LuxR family transcriptional regulator n=1 Tax=Dethiosulfatarculus sandiegensis TaxID=1429043 RepID=A0A0D2HQR4_9BACT|nr:response regulator transcription factor [Dethiosulfatarculus sandiegensis]KIX12818.1 LuxR family transcriptional regulator [Dethiosulfatarculus sandiegensis]
MCSILNLSKPAVSRRTGLEGELVMKGSDESHVNNSKPLDNVCLVALGRSELKNSLLHFFLTQNGGATCTMYSFAAGQNGLTEGDISDCDLVILDVAGLSEGEVFKYLALAKSASVSAALFDLDRSTHIEKQALKRGAKGFFYVRDPLDNVIRGVSKIVGGELWVPRLVMERCVLEESSEAFSPNKKNSTLLTRREIEVLNLLTRGGSNMDIADQLFVSVHTVKTHIYNIYQKINVSNRMQAARWAAEHLPELMDS